MDNEHENDAQPTGTDREDDMLRIRFYEYVLAQTRPHRRIPGHSEDECCHPGCQGNWGTGCFCCHHGDYACEVEDERIQVILAKVHPHFMARGSRKIGDDPIADRIEFYEWLLVSQGPHEHGDDWCCNASCGKRWNSGCFCCHAGMFARRSSLHQMKDVLKADAAAKDKAGVTQSRPKRTDEEKVALNAQFGVFGGKPRPDPARDKPSDETREMGDAAPPRPQRTEDEKVTIRNVEGVFRKRDDGQSKDGREREETTEPRKAPSRFDPWEKSTELCLTYRRRTPDGHMIQISLPSEPRSREDTQRIIDAAEDLHASSLPKAPTRPPVEADADPSIDARPRDVQAAAEGVITIEPRTLIGLLGLIACLLVMLIAAVFGRPSPHDVQQLKMRVSALEAENSTLRIENDGLTISNKIRDADIKVLQMHVKLDDAYCGFAGADAAAAVTGAP
ncbi:MAG: septum formation initiator family protein [Polyangiales bacterium]